MQSLFRLWITALCASGFPIIAALAGAAIGRASKKTPKTKAVSGYTTKKGKKVKAYLKKA